MDRLKIIDRILGMSDLSGKPKELLREKLLSLSDANLIVLDSKMNEIEKDLQEMK